MSVRRGNVYVDQTLAGVIEQREDKYIFRYVPEYVQSEAPKAVSLTLPVREKEYVSSHMFPFFDGLIPEGWLLNIAATNWKLNSRDRMGLLLTVCEDCIGNVRVVGE